MNGMIVSLPIQIKTFKVFFVTRHFKLTLQLVEAVFSAGAGVVPSAEQNGIVESATHAVFSLRVSIPLTPHLHTPVSSSHTFTRPSVSVASVDRHESGIHYKYRTTWCKHERKYQSN